MGVIYNERIIGNTTMTFNTKELYKFTRQVYKVLKQHPEKFIIKKLHGEYAYYKREIEENNILEVAIDYRYDLLSSLIHECLHHLHPDWCESKVLITEKNIINQLTTKQVTNMLKRFANVL